MDIIKGTSIQLSSIDTGHDELEIVQLGEDYFELKIRKQGITMSVGTTREQLRDIVKIIEGAIKLH